MSNNQDIISVYGETCQERPPLMSRKSGRYGQFQSAWNPMVDRDFR